MSKKVKQITNEEHIDDGVVVGFSPMVSQAGTMQQAASAQATALINQMIQSQSQDTQLLANSSTSTRRSLGAGTQKTAQKLLRAINTFKELGEENFNPEE